MAKRKKKARTSLDREFWQRFDETTRRLRERIAYYERRIAERNAAEEAAAKEDAAQV